MMKKLIMMATMALGLVAASAPAMAEKAVQVGILTCYVEGGWGLIVTSKKGMSCRFEHSDGVVEEYNGVIRKYGLDIGKTESATIVWAVFAPSKVGGVGRLEGNYAGASGEASFFVGLGANVLVGGLDQSFALQPVSVQQQTGFDIAVGVSRLTLRYLR